MGRAPAAEDKAAPEPAERERPRGGRGGARRSKGGGSDSPAKAPAARVAPARRAPQPANDAEADHSHLPAFLLRPVRVKA
jgi:hypothetical protein